MKWRQMWNKLKGFLGFLIVAGCIMVWFSFIPIDPLRTHSGQLGWYGLLLAGFSFLAFFIVLILHGVNEHIHRFRPEPRRIVRRSKGVTKAVAVVSVLALFITGLGWWLARPYLLAWGALSPDEVASHPEQYLGEEVSVVGYYYSLLGLGRLDNSDGAIYSMKMSEAGFEDWMDVFQGKELPLLVKLPPNTKANIDERYVFTGVIEMDNFLYITEWPKIVVSSIVEI